MLVERDLGNSLWLEPLRGMSPDARGWLTGPGKAGRGVLGAGGRGVGGADADELNGRRGGCEFPAVAEPDSEAC